MEFMKLKLRVLIRCKNASYFLFTVISTNARNNALKLERKGVTVIPRQFANNHSTL